MTVHDKHKNAYLWPYKMQTLHSVNKTNNQNGWCAIYRSHIKLHLDLINTDEKVNLWT
jgi:hypothetical protein